MAAKLTVKPPGAHEARPYDSEVGTWLVRARFPGHDFFEMLQERTISF